MGEHPLLKKLKSDLYAIHSDWQNAAHDQALRTDPSFLEKFATDVMILDQDAVSVKRVGQCREKASLVHHLLSTPWGAPFISEMTLLEAAQTFKNNPEIPSPFYLMVENFARFESEFKSQIFNIFDDITGEL